MAFGEMSLSTSCPSRRERTISTVPSSVYAFRRTVHFEDLSNSHSIRFHLSSHLASFIPPISCNRKAQKWQRDVPSSHRNWNFSHFVYILRSLTDANWRIFYTLFSKFVIIELFSTRSSRSISVGRYIITRMRDRWAEPSDPSENAERMISHK